MEWNTEKLLRDIIIGKDALMSREGIPLMIG
mgnify:CR=1 FL=1